MAFLLGAEEVMKEHFYAFIAAMHRHRCAGLWFMDCCEAAVMGELKKVRKVGRGV